MKQQNKLSKGCQLCQQGKWLCIFITYKCNGGCHFCPAPFQDDRIQSAFGNKKEEVLPYLKKYNFEGVSFSGGDPFLVFDRLMEWFVFFKKHLPNLYYWVYTNGLSADKIKLQQLAETGMNEIRFNIAATGYNSELIWERIKKARQLFPFVSIEIPSINGDFELLKETFDRMETTGVDYLNLHDYIINKSDTGCNNEPTENFVLNKINHIKIARSSPENTKKIISLTLEKGYRFQINACSMHQKELQMTMRRLKMGKVFYDPEYDIILQDGTICNFYQIPAGLTSGDIYQKLTKNELREGLKPFRLRADEPTLSYQNGFKILRAIYLPQMEKYRDKTLISVDVY